MAAIVLRGVCDDRGVRIYMLQPFKNFEGWPADSPERREVFERARGWMKIMEGLGTDMLQVESSDLPEEEISTDREVIVNDLRELADLLATKG